MTLLGCRTFQMQAASNSDSDPRIYPEIDLLLGLIECHAAALTAAQANEKRVWGVDLPTAIVQQLASDRRLRSMQLIAKKELKPKSDGFYAFVEGRRKRVPVLSFQTSEFRSSNLCVVSLTEYTAPFGASTWVVEMQRQPDGGWVLIKKTLAVVS